MVENAIKDLLYSLRICFFYIVMSWKRFGQLFHRSGFEFFFEDVQHFFLPILSHMLFEILLVFQNGTNGILTVCVTWFEKEKKKA